MVEHLLLIEDSERDAVLLRALLRDARVVIGRVSWARCLNDGLAVIASDPPDLVLLDLSLPEGRGLEVVRPVHAAAPHVPILAMSGRVGTRLAAESVRLGVHDFVSKERLDAIGLRASIRLVCMRAAVTRELRETTERERLLRELIGSIASARHHDEVLDAAVEGLGRVLPVERVRVHWYVRGPRGPEPVPAPGAGPAASAVPAPGSLEFLAEVDLILGDDHPVGGWFQVEHGRSGHVYRILPVGRVDGCHGVLALRPRSDVRWSPAQDQLLDTVSQAVSAAVGHTLEARALRRSLMAHEKMAAYMPQGVADRFLAAPEADHDRMGRRQDAVVLLVDVVGFTAWSETRDPRLVVEVLNGWFGVVDAILSRHGAILDKHMGDAVMAVFQADPGAREPRREMAWRALAACAEVMRAFDPNAGADDFQVHLAASLGQVLLGPVGSRHRTEYTVIGDTVNVASRLATLATPGALVINRDLRDAVPDEALLRLGVREYGRSAQVLRGRSAAIEVVDLGLSHARGVGIPQSRSISTVSPSRSTTSPTPGPL